MITSITIEDFVLVERLDLALGEGLNVLTGGSGEGKTLVVRALRFLCGGEGAGRAAAARLVRAGASEARVGAVVRLGPAIRAALAAAGVPAAEGHDEVVVRRALDRAGRGRATVASGGGEPRPVPLAALRAIGDAALEVFGQGEASALAGEARQRSALDAAAGLGPEARDYGERRERALALARQRDALELEEERLRVEGARWREERAALAELDPRPDEYASLVAAAEGLAGQEAALGALGEALGLLEDDDAGAVERARGARARLERLDLEAPGLDAARRALDDALERLAEAADGARRARERLEVDAEAAAEVRDRLAQWRALARRLRTAPEALASRWAELAGVEAPDDLAARRADVEAALGPQERDLERRAASLSQARAAAAPRLTAGVLATLPGLGLEGAAFEVRVEPVAAGDGSGPAGTAEARLLAAHPHERGRDRVTFHFAPGPGQALAPLDRASGGELARLFLALGLETAAAGGAALLVFDEVDQNVGARLGAAIGACLAGIGRGRQVLAVTHLATVAARARHHARLVKAQGRSQAVALDDEGRVEELALMIKGAPVTAAAREQARELLAEAAAEAEARRPAGGAAPARRARGRRRGTDATVALAG